MIYQCYYIELRISGLIPYHISVTHPHQQFAKMNFEEFTITQIAERDKSLIQSYNFVLAPGKYQLVDTRRHTDFKLVTLGGYPRSKVPAAMEKAIYSGKIEHACYWAFQLLASGAPITLWDRLLGYAYKHVNIANAKLPRWLQEKTTAWQRVLVRKDFAGPNVINSRNLQQVRHMITEVIVVLSLSRKRKLDTLSAKIKETDFIISNFQDRCTNRGNMIISPLLGDNDPSEIRLAANEFAVNLGMRNMQGALYWLNWILYWERINIKRFKSFTIQARMIDGIPQTDIRDVIWLVWSIIHQVRARVIQDTESVRPAGELGQLERQLDALWAMYIHRWKPSSKSKRLPLIYWSMHYLVYPVDWSGEVIDRLDILVKATANTNMMFEKLRAQCNNIGNGSGISSGSASGFGSVGGSRTPALTGASLLDNLRPTGHPSSTLPQHQLQQQPIIPTIDVVVKNNYKMPEKQEEELLAAREEIKKKRAAKAAGVLPSDSAAKLDAMARLDRYLTT